VTSRLARAAVGATLLTFLVSGAAAAQGEERSARDTDDAATVTVLASVLLLVGPEASSERPDLQETIASFVVLAVQSAGLTVQRRDVGALPNTVAALAVSAAEAPLSLSGEEPPEQPPVAVLALSHSAVGSSLTLAMVWYNLDAEAPEATHQQTGELDVFVDRFLSSAVANRLANVVVPEPLLVAAAPLEVVEPQRETATAPGATTQPIPILRWAAVAGSGPIIPIGAAASVVEIGVRSRLSVTYQLGDGPSLLAVGIAAGVYPFAIVGAVASSDNLLVPFGITVGYVAVVNARRKFFSQLSAGGAVFRINPNQLGVLTKLVPHLSVGFGTDIQVLPWLGIGFELVYEAFFEEILPVTGFAPSLRISLGI
jgi:hypothetical protein